MHLRIVNLKILLLVFLPLILRPSLVNSDSSFVAAVAVLEQEKIAEVYQEIQRSGTTFVISNDAAIFPNRELLNPVKYLSRYDRLHRLETVDGWIKVRTIYNETGWIPDYDVSRHWIYVSKQDRSVTLVDGVNPRSF